VSLRWQVGLIALLLVAPLAAEKRGSFEWTEPRIGPGAFTGELGMLGREREDYASNLAQYAINQVAEEKASARSLEQARRLFALALHLAPRNRETLVASYQLGRGILPEAREGEYSGEVLARLLFTRAQMLRQQGGEEDRLLARIFTELAAEVDPRNEDAVYAAEVQRLDHGRVDWELLTDFRKGRGEAGADGSGADSGGDEVP